MIFQRVFNDDIMMKFGIDASDASAGIAKIIRMLNTYGVTVDDITSGTMRFNSEGIESVRTFSAVTKEGNRLNLSLKNIDGAWKSYSVSVKEAKNNNQRLKESFKQIRDAQRQADLQQKRLADEAARMERKQLGAIKEDRSRARKQEEARAAEAARMERKHLAAIKEDRARARQKELAGIEAQKRNELELARVRTRENNRLLSEFRRNQQERERFINSYRTKLLREIALEKAAANAASVKARRQASGARGIFGGLLQAGGRGLSLGGLGTAGSGLSSILGSGLRAGAAATVFSELLTSTGAGGTGGLAAMSASAAGLGAGLSLVVGGAVAAAAGITAFVGAVASGVPAAAEFSRQIAEIRTISQDSQLTIGQWAAGVSELSDKFAIQRGQVAEGIYQTLSNQVAQGAESFKFLEQAANLSILQPSAGLVSSINAISSVVNSYGLEAKEAERISAVLFATMREGRFRLNEVESRIGRMTFLAAQMGVSFEEASAGLALLTRKGLPAGEAMTLMVNVMSKLIKATPELREVYQKWGVETGQQAVQAFGFGGVLQKLAQEINGNSESMSQLFKELRAFRGIAGLAENGARDYQDTLKSVTESQGQFNAALRDTRSSVGFLAQQGYNEMKNALSELSDLLLSMGVATGTQLGILGDGRAGGFRQWLRGINEELQIAVKLKPSIMEILGLDTTSNLGERLSQALGFGNIPGAIAATSRDLMKDRSQAIAKYVADAKAKFREYNIAQEESFKKQREGVKRDLDIRSRAQKQIIKLQEERLTELRKFSRDANAIQREYGQTQEAGLRGTTQTNIQARELLDRVAPGLGQSLLGSRARDVGIEMLSARTRLRAAMQSGDVEGVRGATQTSISILEREKNNIFAALGNISQAELANASPQAQQAFIQRVMEARNLQEQIGALKRKELDYEIMIQKQNEKKAIDLEKQIELNKQRVRDNSEAVKKLIALDPKSFTTREEGLAAFDAIGNGIVDRALGISAEEGSRTSGLVAQLRGQLSVRLSQKEVLKEINSDLNNLSKITKSVSQEGGDAVRKFTAEFDKLEESIRRSAGALAGFYGAATPDSSGLQAARAATQPGPVNNLFDPNARRRVSDIRESLPPRPDERGGSLLINVNVNGNDANGVGREVGKAIRREARRGVFRPTVFR